MKELLELFCTFAQIGALTFGGGLAMLPMLKHELVDKKEWVTEEELLDYYAIGQCTPCLLYTSRDSPHISSFPILTQVLSKKQEANFHRPGQSSC